MARRNAGAREAPAPVRAAPPPASSAPTGERRKLALAPRTIATPPTATAVGVQARTDGAATPIDAAACAAATGKFVPPSLRAAVPGGAPGATWREREAARKAAGGDASPAPTSPAAVPESKPSSYRPPGATGGSGWRDREAGAGAGAGDRPRNAWAKRS